MADRIRPASAAGSLLSIVPNQFHPSSPNLVFVQIMVHKIGRRLDMNVISYSDTRAHLKEVMDRVVADRAPVVISRQKAESVVMISLSDWNAIEETMHLLSTENNRDRLMAAVRQLEGGDGTSRELIQP
jgi:antitoxin YefM